LQLLPLLKKVASKTTKKWRQKQQKSGVKKRNKNVKKGVKKIFDYRKTVFYLILLINISKKEF
jgi:hypothetical protein